MGKNEAQRVRTLSQVVPPRPFLPFWGPQRTPALSLLPSHLPNSALHFQAWTAFQKNPALTRGPLWPLTLHLNLPFCSWTREWQPTPVLLPGESHGQRRAWWATVDPVTKSRTRLSDFHSLYSFCSSLALILSSTLPSRDSSIIGHLLSKAPCSGSPAPF